MLKSEHFELRELAEGVYAAIADPLGAAFCNAGIIDLGGLTLVFDSFDVPQPAEEMSGMVRQLTGRPADFLIISHWHGDHWGGSQAFGEAVMLSTHECRRQMGLMIKDIQALAADPSEMKEMLRQFEQAYEKEPNPAQKEMIHRRIVRLRYTLESLPTLRARLPEQTFDGEMVFHGAKRSARLESLGFAHSRGDARLILPDDGIVFCGDLLFAGRQPFLGSAHLRTWKKQIDSLVRLNASSYVPGHGPLGGVNELAMELAYLEWAEGAVVEARAAGKSLEDVLNLPLPQAFAAWPDSARISEGNARWLFARAKK